MKNFMVLFFICKTLVLFGQNQIPEIGQEYQGGIIVQKSGDHGLIMAKSDLADEMIWEMAKYSCEKLEIGGYKGWRLPNNFEWIVIYKFWKKFKIGNFPKYGKYWSFSDGGRIEGALTAWVQDITNGGQYRCRNRESEKYPVRAIRNF